MKKMKLFAFLFAIMLCVLAIPSSSQAATKPPGIIYQADPYCGIWGSKCPITYMLNRYGNKRLARYAPNMGNYCNTGAMNVWIMGHPNNAYGAGFTNEDWQDIEVAKQKSGGWYRWGCCYSSDPYNTICLN